MPKAYAVVTYRSISDPEKLAIYAKLALPAVTPFGARFLARGNAAVAREQGLKERTVVVEYPSLEKATAAYDATEPQTQDGRYQNALAEELREVYPDAVTKIVDLFVRITNNDKALSELHQARPAGVMEHLGSAEHCQCFGG